VTDAERRAALEAIAREVRTCTRCRLHQGRTNAVPGEGDASTEVVFVGEGPGEQEDRQGRPFVGASGQLLTELIGSLGWDRSDVFITNVVKCRPPGNRDPQADEVEACRTFLRRQLDVLDPAVVVTVGKHSLASFRPGERIGRTHGTAVPVDPDTGARNALAFAMYHPAFALYQSTNRQTLFDDIALLPGVLLDARERRSASPPEAAEAPRTGADGSRSAAQPDQGVADRAAVRAGIASAGIASAGTVPSAGAGPADDADQLTLF
jgi:uracil-DNA glycosylase family 4